MNEEAPQNPMLLKVPKKKPRKGVRPRFFLHLSSDFVEKNGLKKGSVKRRKELHQNISMRKRG